LLGKTTMMVLVGIGAYLLVLLGIGLGSRRKILGVESFCLADRRGGLLPITASLLATVIGGSSTIGMAGRGHAWGLVGAWWLLVGTVGLILLALFFARRVRETGLVTLPELMEKQYSSGVKLVASVLIVWAWLGIIGGQIAAAGKVLHSVLPGDSSLYMAAAAGVFILYTLIGGQVSVIRTDLLQAAILICSIPVCALISLHNVGGFAELQRQLPADHLRFPVNDDFSWGQLLEWLFLIGSAYLVGPDIFSRLLCSRNVQVAQRSAFFAALAMIPFALFIVLIGMSARVIAPAIPAEEAFPFVIRTLLPTGVDALVMTALLAAIMSSADTVLLTAGTIFSIDIVNELVRRRRGRACRDRTLLLLTRLAVLGFGVMALLLALRLRGVLKLLLFGYSVYASGVVVPALFGFFRDKLRLTPTGAVSAVVAGGGCVLLGGSLLSIKTGLPGLLLSLIFLFAGSYVPPLLGLGRRDEPGSRT
jgi:SSS family solute:Na+ symporter